MVQVLTQSRRDLIETTFASLDGARTAIVHLYNAVSPAWRKIVFGMTRGEVKRIAIDGAMILRDEAGPAPRHRLALRIQPRDLLNRRARFLASRSARR